jgi:thiamine biosynthesis lipoprotein
VNQAIVTSGEYEKYVIVDGERYGHIINPKTGIPSKGILSVSILTSTAELADALATTVFVLGEKDGLALINHLEGVEGIIINQENKVLYSSKLKDWFADE